MLPRTCSWSAENVLQSFLSPLVKAKVSGAVPCIQAASLGRLRDIMVTAGLSVAGSVAACSTKRIGFGVVICVLTVCWARRRLLPCAILKYSVKQRSARIGLKGLLGFVKLLFWLFWSQGTGVCFLLFRVGTKRLSVVEAR